MRDIHVSVIVDAVKKLCMEANWTLEPDMLRAFDRALDRERSPAGRQVLQILKQNAELARTRQVLCVTHLPQIAAYADQHFRVEKREEDGRTATSVAALVKNDRVREVARMLGGESVTDTSLQHALELITQARGK